MEINKKLFCFIEKLNTMKFSHLMEVQKEIERFFIKIQDTNVIEIIPIENISRKCISIVTNSETFLTYCVDNEEHD